MVPKHQPDTQWLSPIEISIAASTNRHVEVKSPWFLGSKPILIDP